jgi:two-component system sensor histidine kinase QseC
VTSIRRQLTRELLAVYLVLSGCGVAAVYLVARWEVVREFDDLLRAKALAVGGMTAHRSNEIHVPTSDQFLENFREVGRYDFFEIWFRDGERIGRSPSMADADLPRFSGSFDHPKYWNLTLPTGRAGRAIGYVFTPKLSVMVHHPLPKVELELVVATDRESLDHNLTLLLATAIGCSVFLVLVTPWVVRHVLGRGLLPIARLAEQAAGIDAESLATRFNLAEVPVEVRPIFARLNDVLARLEDSFERERRFSADVAHELRTPVAELRSMVECAVKWPQTRDDSTDGEILAVTVQMERMVGRMLSLARSESRQIAVESEPVELDAFVRQAWNSFAQRAKTRRLNVTIRAAKATASVDPVLFASILKNLFENAAVYTPEGGSVDIRAEAKPDGFLLTVANSTLDLEAADIDHLFDRFWRKQAARTEGQHVGLGLSITRTFALAMGWTLSASLDQERRLVISLESGITPSAGRGSTGEAVMLGEIAGMCSASN